VRFTETTLRGVWLIDLDLKEDERGFFARLWCSEAMAARGLGAGLAQCSLSYNRRRGTVRGMHWQEAPFAEAKVVHCITGAIYDVALDMREGSPTFGRWFAAELTAKNRRMLYVPEGCAHGFQTLADHSEMLYLTSTAHVPALARGVCWDDPTFGIQWPLPRSIISTRDLSYPRWNERKNV
jgi:dTDP-4-dehydrorhamnose 3,5-epimerase